MSEHRRLILKVAAPFVIAALTATWLLWTRGEPSRQGGYCMNATIEISAVLRRADATSDIGRGPLPPLDKILRAAKDVDAARFQVDTPPAIQDQVDTLARSGDPAAFALIAADYLQRCRRGPEAAS